LRLTQNKRRESSSSRVGSATRNYIRVAQIQPPCTRFILPDIREAAFDRLPGDQPGTRRVADRLNGFEPHDDDEAAVGTDKLDLALERRKIDDARPYKHVLYGAFSHYYLVVRRVEDEMVGPQSFQGGTVAVQSGNPLLVVERAHEFFVRAVILCHGDRP